MANPTIFATTNNVGAAAGSTVTATVPAGVTTGDVGLMLVHGNTSATTTASTPTGYTLLSGPTQGGASVAEDWVFSKNLTSSDAGATVSSTVSGSFRWASAYVVVRGGSFDTAATASATSTTTTTNTLPAFTPVADDCLAVLLMGMSSSSGSGTYSTTPPTGWTEKLDAASNYGSAADQSVYAAVKQLSGQGGTLQTSVTCDSTVTHRAAAFVLTFAPVNAPVAAFSSSSAGLVLSVDGTGSTATSPATISSYDWDWGDGTTHGAGSTATHTYSDSGTYTVVLTVTDSASHTGSVSHDVTVAAPADSASVQSITVSTGWTPSAGTALACITDGDSTTFVTSSAGPSNLEFDFILFALDAPASGQPLKVFLTMDALTVSSSATVDAQLVEGTTTRSSLTDVAIPSGSGTSVTGAVVLTFPWTDISVITDWSALKVKLQVTAS